MNRSIGSSTTDHNVVTNLFPPAVSADYNPIGTHTWHSSVSLVAARRFSRWFRLVRWRRHPTARSSRNGRANERKTAERGGLINVTGKTHRRVCRVSWLWAHQKRNAVYILSPLGVVGFHQKPSPALPRRSPAAKISIPSSILLSISLGMKAVKKSQGWIVWKFRLPTATPNEPFFVAIVQR